MQCIDAYTTHFIWSFKTQPQSNTQRSQLTKEVNSIRQNASGGSETSQSSSELPFDATNDRKNNPQKSSYSRSGMKTT